MQSIILSGIVAIASLNSDGDNTGVGVVGVVVVVVGGDGDNIVVVGGGGGGGDGDNIVVGGGGGGGGSGDGDDDGDSGGGGIVGCVNGDSVGSVCGSGRDNKSGFCENSCNGECKFTFPLSFNLHTSTRIFNS